MSHETLRLLVCTTVLVASLGSASADTDADSDEAPTPVAVRGSLRGATAMLTARFELDAISGERGGVQIELPIGAAAIAATVTIGGTAHVLALRPAVDADRMFSGLAEAPVGDHPGSAIEITSGFHALEVSIIVAKRSHVSIVIDMTAPTCFYGDARYVIVPPHWKRATANLGDVRPDRDKVLTACHANEWSSGGTPAVFGFVDRGLATRPSGPERIGGFAGRLALADDHFARVELALASELTDVPTDLHTVLVLDGSRSLDPPQVAAQSALVASYLKLAPTSSVQVIVVARTAQALLGGWTTAAQAAPSIAKQLAQLELRNGSNLDVGLAEAAAWLARTTGTRRAIVFSDELWASRITDLDKAKLAAVFPADTLVHAVSLSEAQGSVGRDDDLALAPLARATEGIAVDGRVDDHGHADATMLLRPISLEHIVVHAPSWESFGDSSCEAIAAGESCVWWEHGDLFSGPIVIAGELWTHPVEYAFRPDPARGRELARELTATELVTNERVMAAIGRAADAVNGQLSLIATWGGDDGVGEGESFASRSGRFSTSTVDTGYGQYGAIGRRTEPGLRERIGRIVANCRAAAFVPETAVSVEIELTRDEIASVTIVAADAVRSCIEDRLWDMKLQRNKPTYYATEHFTY